ncbi:MAG: DUF4340 domain-containing protein, partial [Gammaproteobacteria bacterium]|nr:DUF4340 domain-containing protein [Gammaproteobacteria bacterium]
MNNRALLNLLLVLIAITLGLVVWLQPGVDEPPEEHRVIDIARDDIRHIIVHTAETLKFELQKQDGIWSLLRPYDAHADNVRVETILDALNQTSNVRYASDNLDLERYELAHGDLVAEINGIKLAFGDTEPLTGKRYILSGDYVYLVDDMLSFRLRESALTLVSKKLLSENAVINAIRFPDFTVIRSDPGWELRPDDTNVSADNLQTFVDSWSQARATRVKKE